MKCSKARSWHSKILISSTTNNSTKQEERQICSSQVIFLISMTQMIVTMRSSRNSEIRVRDTDVIHLMVPNSIRHKRVWARTIPRIFWAELVSRRCQDMSMVWMLIHLEILLTISFLIIISSSYHLTNPAKIIIYRLQVHREMEQLVAQQGQ